MSRFALVGPIHPLRGGIAQHTTGIVREARARGHEVRIVSYRRQYPGLLFPGRTQLDTAPAPPEAGEGTTAPIDSLQPLSWLGAASEVEEFRPEVVLLQRWHPFFAPALATIARRARRTARVAWMVHNARPHEGGGWWGPLLRTGYGAQDVCLVHAEVEEVSLRSLGVRGAIRRVPMPTLSSVRRVDAAAARRRLELPDGDVVFVFFGHVRPYKGVDVLVRALQHLAPTGPTWSAVIAGEWYVDPAPVRSQIDAAGLTSRVRVLDHFLAPTEVDDVFAAATVVVLPYVAGTQSAVAPLAYAYGRPVITTKVGGLPEAVRDAETGFLVDPADPVALAAALEQVRRGARFSYEAIGRAHARASFGSLLDEIEAIVRAPLFP